MSTHSGKSRWGGTVRLAMAMMVALVIYADRAGAETWGYITQLGASGTGNGQFSSPTGIATDAAGTGVYVADTGNNRVQKFTSAGVTLTYNAQWGTAGTGNSQFNAPTGIAATGNRVYVTDYGNNRIHQYNLTGTFQWVFPSTDVVAGSGNGDFNGPTGIAVAGAAGAGRAYVMDSNNNRIQTNTVQGGGSPAYDTQWGTGGTGNNQYSGATGVAANSTLALVYIADTGNNRYQKTNLTGTYNSQFGLTGTGDGQFTNPAYVAVDTSGNVFVTDRSNNRVQKISAAGAYVAQWGTSGTGNSQFNSPRGINVDINGNVFVVDSGNSRIQKFGLVPEVSSVVRAGTDPTNAATRTYTVTFNTGVTGVDTADFTLTTTGVSGASVTTVAAVSTSVYTITVNTGTGTGTIRLDVLDNDTILSATVGATTLNLLSTFTTGEVYTVLKTAPTITLSSASASSVNTAISVTATLSASSTDFISTDITPTNAVVSGFSGSGASYTFTLTPSANGVFSAIVNANTFTDAIPNQNTVSNSLSRTYDNVSPGITLSSAAPEPTNAAIPISVTLTESSADFGVGDITVTNGVAGSFSGSGLSYSFTVTPSGLGTVTATVNAGQFTDAAGNFSTASNTISRTYNNTQPSVTLSSAAPDPVNGAISVTASLSASSTNFVSTDVTPTNAAVSAFAGSGVTYTFTLTPSSQGSFSVVVNAGVFTDSISNLNTVSNTLSRTFDSVAPGITLSSTDPDPTNAAISVSVTLTESSADFASSDISVVNGTAGSFSGSGTAYSFTLTPSGVGLVSATVNAGNFSDSAGNLNTVSNTLSRTYNNVSPSVSLTTAASDPVNGAISVTASLSATSVNFAVGDVTPANATVSNFAGSGATYTFTLTPVSQGTFSAEVQAGVFTDAATNANTASNVLSRTYDSVVPTIALSTSAPDPTNASIGVSVLLSESSTDFDVSDISVTNGTAGSFSGSGVSYSFTITPAGLGLVTATVNAGQFTDAAGNVNTASNTITRTYNNASPAITLTSSAPDPVNAAISVTASLSAPSVNFVAGDITLANAALSVFLGSGDTYTFTLTPSVDGSFSANVQAGKFTDAATNPNTASNTLSRTYDSIDPSITLSSSAPDPTNATIDVAVLLNESSTDFDVSDVSVVNGSAGGFSGSGVAYSFTVTPAGTGLVSATVNAGRFTDAAGNSNTVSNTITRTYNNVSPAITLASSAPDPVNAAISVTASLSADSVNFAQGDITPSNAAVSGFSGSGSTYTFTLTPAVEGSFSVEVSAGVFTDAATNPNTASNTLSRTYDGTPPDIALSSTAPDPTNAAIDISVLLGESSADFDLGDISVTNGAAGSFSGSGVSYSFTITPAGLGLVSATVNAGQFTDAAGNLSTASNTIDRTYNNASPAITLTSTDPDPVNTAIFVTASLSAPSVNFTALDITRINATVSAFSGSGDTYTFTLTPSAEGNFSAEVDAGRFTDAATNVNTASNLLSRTFDTTMPDISLSSTAPDPTNADILVDVLLSEPNTDFDSADISVINGSATNFSGSGTTFSFTITPAGQGLVSATVDAGQFADAAGNLNTVSNAIDRTYDGIAPGIVLSSSDPDPTNAAISVEVALSEPSADFTDTDLIVTNGTVGGFAGTGDTYSFTITPAGQGAVTALVDAGGFSDEAGNLNTASNVLSRTFDTVAPAITLSSSAPDPTNAEIEVDVLLSEFSTDFAIDDLVITNGVAGSFSGGADTYVFTITPAGLGLVSATVDAGAFSDAAGNANTASNVIERTYDNASPTIILASTAPALVNAAVAVTATLSAPSADFDAGDVTPTNGTVSDFAGSGDSYSFTLTPSADGNFSVAVDAGVFSDALANTNTASNVLSRTFDGTVPSATLFTTTPDPTNGDIAVTVELSEPSADFEEADISVTNGVTSGFSGAIDAYSFTITPTGPGLVTVQVNAGTFTDSATNANTASVALSWTFDNEAPSIALSSTAPPTTSSDIPVSVLLSESSANFDVGDISVTNGAAGSFSGSGDTYDMMVTPAGPGLVTVTVDAGTFTDAAGNPNTASNAVTRTYNNALPAITLDSDDPNPTNGPITVLVLLSVPSADFELEDIQSVNASVSDFSGNADAYSFTLTPSAQGLFSASVDAGAFTDALANPNTASNLLSRVFDSVAPTVSVQSLVTSDSRPPLAGAVDDASASVSVTVGSQTRPATNHGNGTWTLADNALGSLAGGTYNVIVAATDSAGNTGLDVTTGELTIDLSISIFPGGFIEEGDTVELTGPAGTSYRWQRNGVNVENAPPRVTGITSRTLRLSPALELDSGSYKLVFNDGAKILIESAPVELVVHPVQDLPVAGPGGLIVISALMLAAYVFKSRKR